jgi:hypothetical protein
MKRKTFLIVLLLLIVTVSGVQAMSSAGYHLGWFTPLTGNGGGPASSAHYTANVTVGQTAIYNSTSAHYQARMGYWSGFYPGARIYLPAVQR